MKWDEMGTPLQNGFRGPLKQTKEGLGWGGPVKGIPSGVFCLAAGFTGLVRNPLMTGSYRTSWYCDWIIPPQIGQGYENDWLQRLGDMIFRQLKRHDMAHVGSRPRLRPQPRTLQT